MEWQKDFKTKQALEVLGITSGIVTLEEVKKARRSLMLKFHTDINPNGEVFAKAINNAYDFLCKLTFPLNCESKLESKSYLFDLFSDILKDFSHCNDVNFEICGVYLWATGNIEEYEDLFDKSPFTYASKKNAWYFCPKKLMGKRRRKKTFSMDEIRDRHGHQRIFTKRNNLIN